MVSSGNDPAPGEIILRVPVFRAAPAGGNPFHNISG